MANHPKKVKLPEIVDKKLGRNKALGICYVGDGLIEIDPRQTPLNYFKTIIHELLHEAFPNMSEKEVIRVTTLIARGLWKKNFRKVSL